MSLIHREHHEHDTRAPREYVIATNDSDRRRFAAIVERVPADATRILDVGCVRHDRTRRAWGNLHAHLHMQFPAAEIIGIDIDAVEAERMAAPGYDIRVMDCQDMAFDAPFDAIIAGETIEHLADPGAFLRSAGRHLTPEGRLILTTPNPGAIRYWLRTVAGNWTSRDHTGWIDARQLETLAERSGSGLAVGAVEYLPPTLRVARVLYRAGRERASAPSYVAVLKPEAEP